MKPARVHLACAILLAGLTACAAAVGAEFKEGEHGPATLKIIEGVPVLHVYGTPEEMGEQHGTLFGPQVQLLLDRYLNKMLLPAGRDVGLRDAVLKQARVIEKSIPEDYVKEMKALATAAGVEYDDVLLANTVFDIKRVVYCSTVVAVGERSADGKPIFGRNLDFPTLGVAQDYSCIVVMHPEKGHAVAAVTFPGIVGVLSGLNDAGVAAATMEVHLRGVNLEAMPYAMLFRTALTGADSTADVIKTVTDNARTTTNNLMVCDAEGDAACVELAIRKVAVRRPEEGVVYATNHFRSKELGSDWICWRIPRIRKALENGVAVDDALMKKMLDSVAQRHLTMHSMIFRPASRELLLAIGEPPVTKNRFVRFKESVLFPEEEGQ